MTLLYRLIYLFARFVELQTIRFYAINSGDLRRRGGYVLAVTHISHLEVALTALLSRRQIHWLARKEFYANRLASWFLNATGCLKVNRQGVPVSTIRAAIQTARSGHVVGIFPEGGVVRGNELAIRGGTIKRGMCSIAIHAGVPIIPCVILGTEKLNRVAPWLPFGRAKVWVAVGEPILPAIGTRSCRTTRRDLAEQVQTCLIRLYGQLQARYGISDKDVP